MFLRVRAWKRENAQLRQRIAELEQALGSNQSSRSPGSGPSAHPSTSEPLVGTPLTSDSRDADEASDEEPFGTGALILSPDGNLHLGAEATFFRPRHFLIPHSSSASATLLHHDAYDPRGQKDKSNVPDDLFEGFLFAGTGGTQSSRDTGRVSPATEATFAPHEVPYLPASLEKSTHQHLLHLFFAYTPTFGMNSFQEQFTLSMRTDPMRKQLYFSPLLHLVCLGIGSRYQVGRFHSESTQFSGEEYATRGHCFIERARAMVDSEADAPTLGTIIALVFLSIYCFGMMSDQAASNYYAIAIFLVQEFRLHRRCDEQLRALGLEPDSELDVARRDVYGFVRNFSECLWCFFPRRISLTNLFLSHTLLHGLLAGSWWTNYFARLSLNLSAEENQRPPFLRTSSDPAIRTVSIAFRKHCQLSNIGHKIVFCNHFMRASFNERLTLAKRLGDDLLAW